MIRADHDQADLPGVVIAGVTKAATTSLFTYLSSHPQIAPSRVKETYHFLPIRYGNAPEPLSAYRQYFRGTEDGQVCMEATPGYFYGGSSVARAIREACPDVHVILCFRDPYERLVSFFRFYKEKGHLPQDMPLSAYVHAAAEFEMDELDRVQALEKWTGVAGGLYDRHFDDWYSAFGSRLIVTWFDAVSSDPQSVVDHITRAIHLKPVDFKGHFSQENATVKPRMRALHTVALRANAALEVQLRARPELKRRLRSIYQTINAGKPEGLDLDLTAADTDALFGESLGRFREQLIRAGSDTAEFPSWLR
jgi:hypothetical protein